MGGKEGGEIASREVIETIIDFFSEAVNKGINSEELKETLNKGFLSAQTSVADIVAANKGLKGMGTTLAILFIHENRYVWGNIGDSRIYIMNNGCLRLATNDHTLIAEFQKNNKEALSPYIVSHYGNFITKVVDGGSDRADLYPAEGNFSNLKEGDLFLICSDGLIINKTSDMIEVILELITQNPSLKTLPRKLVKWALDNGSDDNISVVIAGFGIPSFIREDKIQQSVDDASKTLRIVNNKEANTK